MNFRGKKTIIRPIKPEDLQHILTWNNDSEVQEFLGGDSACTLEKCREWYNQGLSDRHAKHYLICSEAGIPLGDLELVNISWRSGDAELRIRIGEKAYWNHGYGTDSLQALLRHAFCDMGLNRIYLRVYCHNTRAIHVYEKCGFKREGILKNKKARDGFQDIVLMRIFRDEYICHVRRSA
ncbi:MAG: GNAT family N-acetyltransferase [Bacillota bacterium]